MGVFIIRGLELKTRVVHTFLFTLLLHYVNGRPQYIEMKGSLVLVHKPSWNLQTYKPSFVGDYFLNYDDFYQ